MKSGIFMDGSTKNKLPSMKNGNFMDGNFILGKAPTIFLHLISTSV